VNIAEYAQFVLALLFVLGLIGGAALLARRLGLATAVAPTGARRRLAVVESIPLDGRRRLLLLRRDSTEHLVILGPSTEVVVERSIAPAARPHAAAEVSDAA
jgi:flagellar protein FliO/FliZ